MHASARLIRARIRICMHICVFFTIPLPVGVLMPRCRYPEPGIRPPPTLGRGRRWWSAESRGEGGVGGGGGWPEERGCRCPRERGREGRGCALRCGLQLPRCSWDGVVTHRGFELRVGQVSILSVPFRALKTIAWEFDKTKNPQIPIPPLVPYFILNLSLFLCFHDKLLVSAVAAGAPRASALTLQSRCTSCSFLRCGSSARREALCLSSAFKNESAPQDRKATYFLCLLTADGLLIGQFWIVCSVSFTSKFIVRCVWSSGSVCWWQVSFVLFACPCSIEPIVFISLTCLGF